jgi:hypothetical protein
METEMCGSVILGEKMLTFISQEPSEENDEERKEEEGLMSTQTEVRVGTSRKIKLVEVENDFKPEILLSLEQSDMVCCEVRNGCVCTVVLEILEDKGIKKQL